MDASIAPDETDEMKEAYWVRGYPVLSSCLYGADSNGGVLGPWLPNASPKKTSDSSDLSETREL